VKPLVTLREPALPAALFRRLRRAVEGLSDARLPQGYQATFWFDFTRPPGNLVEQAVVLLREHLPASRRRGVAGAEWWLSRMRTSNVQVDFHRDRDNALYDATGRTVTPRTSSVLYLNRCRGGLLAVTAEPCDPRNPALAPSRHDFDLVAPKPNRYVFFDGGLTHGVLDAKNQLPAERLPREPGLRLAIAVNYWHRRPRAVPRYAETRRLRGLA